MKKFMGRAWSLSVMFTVSFAGLSLQAAAVRLFIPISDEASRRALTPESTTQSFDFSIIFKDLIEAGITGLELALLINEHLEPILFRHSALTELVLILPDNCSSKLLNNLSFSSESITTLVIKLSSSNHEQCEKHYAGVDASPVLPKLHLPKLAALCLITRLPKV